RQRLVIILPADDAIIAVICEHAPPGLEIAPVQCIAIGGVEAVDAVLRLEERKGNGAGAHVRAPLPCASSRTCRGSAFRSPYGRSAPPRGRRVRKASRHPVLFA